MLCSVMFLIVISILIDLTHALTFWFTLFLICRLLRLDLRFFGVDAGVVFVDILPVGTLDCKDHVHAISSSWYGW